MAPAVREIQEGGLGLDTEVLRAPRCQTSDIHMSRARLCPWLGLCSGALTPGFLLHPSCKPCTDGGPRGVQVATLRSAVKLEQEQQFLIAKKLQELTGSKNIKLKPVLDDSLIAGFVVEYGSSQIDLSVKGQLDKISNELEEAALAA